MKKGVVLFITLLFIMAISVLVLKNLDDTDKFLDNQNYILNNTQVLIAIKNTQNEISKLLKKYKNKVNCTLNNDIFKSPIPIDIEDLKIQFSIKKYEKSDINEMNKKGSEVIKNLFLEYDVFNYLNFEYVYKKKLQNNQKVETSKQLSDIINTFILENENLEIERIIDKLGFSSAKNSCELYISAKYLGSQANSYYLLDNTGKVLYFDISFK